MKKKLHMIGNAHIDPVWLWCWPDGYSEIRATFRSALDRLEEYPEFVFTSACAAFYEWIERMDPDMFKEIQRRVHEGRWDIVGGWWIQPDCNLPSGESFARQALYAQRYFKEKFGKTARIGYNVDSFGHAGTLPQILLLSGMDRYIFMRPGRHEKAVPAGLFHWESPEGHRVVCQRIPFEYCTWGKELQNHVARCLSESKDERGTVCFYGVGNHGGGPTKENIESIQRMQRESYAELIFSSPDRFFDEAQASDLPLPVVNGELLHHASGCYSVHSGMKRANRQSENRLVTAEKWSAIASIVTGSDYPMKDFERAWKKVLFNQDHDILPGTCIKEAFQDAMEDYGFAFSVAQEHLNDALQALARRINIPYQEGSRPMVVFNPHPFTTLSPVNLETSAVPKHYALQDEDGYEIPYQIITASAACYGREKLTFTAEVPPLGYRVYRLIPRDETCTRPETKLNTGCLTLENDILRVEFSGETGSLESIVDKETGVDFLRDGTQALVMIDKSDTWSHAVLRYDQVEGAMRLVSIKRVADGPVCQSIRVIHSYDDSRLIQEYTLYTGQRQVLVHCDVNWQGKQQALKLQFPLNQNHSSVTAQAPFGYAVREMDGEEYPMHMWVDSSGSASGGLAGVHGLAILNDGKYSYDARDRSLFLTVLRSPYCANHDPFVVEDGMNYPVLDQGWQEFNYALYPHIGAMERACIDQYALLLNAPLQTLPESFHSGELAHQESFTSIDSDHVTLDAVKLAEDGSGDVILHLHETVREQTDCKLIIPRLHLDETISFSAGEIKALRIQRDGKVSSIDLLEQTR
ncbi:hypothetical protein AGMMS49992_19510 [Clostridia bacterium]|nr:hypothetical protein AGMMS49992_19510 [Clostridia bacterium]